MRKLKLLVFVTVCWVAPLAAQQAPLLDTWATCPFSQGQTEAKVEDARTSIGDGVPAEGSLLDVSLRREAVAP